MSQDYFVTKAGRLYAGTHIIMDLYEAKRLDDQAYIEQVLRQVVDETAATLLHIYLHPFEINGGISGVAVLAESHISVHTWPERSYAAFDVFMCGDTYPSKAIPLLREAFSAGRVTVQEIMRGEVYSEVLV